VGSELKGGEVQYVWVLSEKGRDLTLVNPWPDQDVSLKRDGKPAETLSGERFTIETTPGERLMLRPAT